MRKNDSHVSCYEGVTFKEYNEKNFKISSCPGLCQFYRIDYLSYATANKINSFIEEWRCGTKEECENWQEMLTYAKDNVASYTGKLCRHSDLKDLLGISLKSG